MYTTDKPSEYGQRSAEEIAAHACHVRVCLHMSCILVARCAFAAHAGMKFPSGSDRNATVLFLMALQGASPGTCLDIELIGARGRSSGQLRLAPMSACHAPFQRGTCDRFQVLLGIHPSDAVDSDGSRHCASSPAGHNEYIAGLRFGKRGSRQRLPAINI